MGFCFNSIMDLLLGLFRGAVFHYGGVPQNCPLALMGRFSSSMGCFSTLMGRFPECLTGPFSLLKSPGKQPPIRKGVWAIVHDCLRLSSFWRRKFPLERGPQGPQKCTFADDCAQIAESGLKPPFESLHLDFPEGISLAGDDRRLTYSNRALHIRVGLGTHTAWRAQERTRECCTYPL